MRRVLLLIVMLGVCSDARAQFVQQGPKLIGTGTGEAARGFSVALSADGNTALVGGQFFGNGSGAVWVWTRSHGTWTEQARLQSGGYSGWSVALSADGNTALVGAIYANAGVGAAFVWTRNANIWTQAQQLAGAGAVGSAEQGYSVALSADGNTALVGGPYDNQSSGAAWVWTRSGGGWTQQGTKLVGAGAVGGAYQGRSVALSADGNTALVGGEGDNNNAGAAWLWTRNGGVWTPQGAKLVGTGASSHAEQGSSVALSADGNTALVGGFLDGSSSGGAVWAWTRSGGIWTQQGSKLVGTGAISFAYQGTSVALSGDGNTALIGGYGDNDSVGATWVWTRSGSVWTQKGTKLVGNGYVSVIGRVLQGHSVALSADGHTAIVGGYGDNQYTGAAWVFVTRALDDFNGDLKADILWRHSSGAVAAWLMNGSQIASGGSFGAIDPSWQIVGAEDHNADGRTDILWRHSSGAIGIWFMDGIEITGFDGVDAGDPASSIVGVGDYNGDGHADILRRLPSGDLSLSLMYGADVIGGGAVATVDPAWQIVGTRDYNGDGRADILWRHTSGATTMWLMNDAQVIAAGGLGVTDPAWQIVGAGDYNGDGFADILWRHTSGALTMWLMNGTQVIGWDGLGVPDPAWQIAGSGDYDGDGRADILWRHTSGAVAIWFMNGTQVIGAAGLGVINPAWQIVYTR